MVGGEVVATACMMREAHTIQLWQGHRHIRRCRPPHNIKACLQQYGYNTLTTAVVTTATTHVLTPHPCS